MNALGVSRASRLWEEKKKIIITLTVVNIEIPIIQKIIFEFENMMHCFIITLKCPLKKKKIQNVQIESVQIENNVQICIQL